MSTGARFSRHSNNTSNTKPSQSTNVPTLGINQGLFMDMGVLGSDRSRKTPRTNAKEPDNKPTPSKEDDKEEASLGLISNAFMGATNKFVKTSTGGSEVIDPTKLLHGDTVNTKSQIKHNQANKLSRSPITNTPHKAEEHQGSKKIERRHAAHRDLKFTQKKEEESTPSVQVPTTSQPAVRKPYARNTPKKPQPETNPQSLYNPYGGSKGKETRQQEVKADTSANVVKPTPKPYRRAGQQENQAEVKQVEEPKPKPVPYQRHQEKSKGEPPAESKKPVQQIKPKPTPYKPYSRGQEESKSEKVQPVEPEVKPKPTPYRTKPQSRIQDTKVETPKQPEKPKSTPYRSGRGSNIAEAKQKSIEKETKTPPEPVKATPSRPYRKQQETVKPQPKPQIVEPLPQQPKPAPYAHRRVSNDNKPKEQPVEPKQEQAKPSPNRPYRKPPQQKEQEKAQVPLKESPAPAKTTPYRGINKQPTKERSEKSIDLKIESQASDIKSKPSPNRPSKQKQHQNHVQAEKVVDDKPKPSPYKPYRRSVQQEEPSQTTTSQIVESQTVKAPQSRSFVQRKPADNTNSKQPAKADNVVTSKFHTKSEIHPSPNRNSDAVRQSILSKSAVAGFVIKRLLRNQLEGAFLAIRQNSACFRVHLSREAVVLVQASAVICKAKEQSLMAVSFELVKKIFKEKIVQEVKPLLNKEYVSPHKAPCLILEKLFMKQLRGSLEHLRHMKDSLKIKTIAIGTLEGSLLRQERSRAAEGFVRIKNRWKDTSKVLGNVWHVAKNHYQNHFAMALLKLALYHPHSQSVKTTPKKTPLSRSPTPVQKQEPIKKIQDNRIPEIEAKVRATKNEIDSLQKSLRMVKQQGEKQEKELQSKIAKLTETNKEASSQIDSKKKRMQKMKQEVASIRMKKSVMPQQENEDSIDTLDTLTHLYVDNFRDSGEDLSSSTLQTLHRQAEVRRGTQILKEWQLIGQNIQLKKQIAGYQNGETILHKARVSLLQQQKVLTRLISSYIKQQYFWQWIHIYTHE